MQELRKAYDDICDRMEHAPETTPTMLQAYNLEIEKLLISCLNDGYVQNVLGTNNHDTRLLLASMTYYRPVCVDPMPRGLETTMAYTDGIGVYVNPAYIWAARSYTYPLVGNFPVSSWERELAGTLIHEAAHLFLNHPARLARMLDAAEYPREALIKVFNMVADVQVEAVGAAAIPEYSGSVIGGDIAVALELDRKLVGRLETGATLIEPVVRLVLDTMKDGGADEQPTPKGMVTPPEDAEVAESKASVSIAAAAQMTGVDASAFIDQFEVPPPKRTLADVLTISMTEVSHHRSMRTLHPTLRNNGVCLPARKPLPGVIAIAVDTSGSMSESDIDRALAEIAGVVESVGAKALLLFSFSTVISEVRRIDAGTPFDRFELSDRGGTSFNRVVQQINSMNDAEDLAAAVILTDGYDRCTTQCRVPLVWGVVDDKRERPDLPGDVVSI